MIVFPSDNMPSPSACPPSRLFHPARYRVMLPYISSVSCMMRLTQSTHDSNSSCPSSGTSVNRRFPNIVLIILRCALLSILSLSFDMTQKTQPYRILGWITALNSRSLWPRGYALSVNSSRNVASFRQALLILFLSSISCVSLKLYERPKQFAKVVYCENNKRVQ